MVQLSASQVRVGNVTKCQVLHLNGTLVGVGTLLDMKQFGGNSSERSDKKYFRKHVQENGVCKVH